MDLINRLTIKNLKLNKKRTIVTIIGIMLSVALITAVASLYTSALSSLTEYSKARNGNFHVAFYNVPIEEIDTIKNHRGVKDIFLTQTLGYATLKDSKNEYKPYAIVKSFDKESLDNLSIRLVSGKLPSNDSEIIIPTHLKTNGRIELNIGDEITLDIGKRFLDDFYLSEEAIYSEDEKLVDTNAKTYKIVGIMERPATNIESYESAGYTFITYLDKPISNIKVDVYTRYNKKGLNDYFKVTSDILGVDYKLYKEYNTKGIPNEYLEKYVKELDKRKYDEYINDSLIILETNPLSDNVLGGLSFVAIIVCGIIVFTSVFCIKNSFDISITEKTKQYGMLRSIGATKKQIRKNVLYEATILGVIGIPLGILLGFIASVILLKISNYLLNGMTATNLYLHYVFSYLSVVVAIVLGIVTIYLSALKSAFRASRVSPINSIRNSANIKIKSRKIKSNKLVNKFFGIGGNISYKNMKRNKKKYRTSIISIAVSVLTFISLTSFMIVTSDAIKTEYTTTDYNLTLICHDEQASGSCNKIYETTRLDNIEEYAVQRSTSIEIKDIKFSKEMLDFYSHQQFDEEDMENEKRLSPITIGEDAYKIYLDKLNIKYEDAKDKIILINNITRNYFDYDKNESVDLIIKNALDYKKGDKIVATLTDGTKMELEIITITEKLPFSLNGRFYSPVLIISDELFEKIEQKEDKKYIHAYFKTNDATKLQDEIEIIMGDEEYYVNNIEESVRMMNNLYLLIAIFLYGFIIVISLIGITNIFNTITASMELRKQEFAMLKSVGMTSSEFNKMIRLESIFIGGKSLLFGIPIGLIISYIIYTKLGKEIGLSYQLPILAIILSILVVFLLITIIMKYSISIINKQNTIETIRNENI